MDQEEKIKRDLKALEAPYKDVGASLGDDECPLHPGTDHFELNEVDGVYLWRCFNPSPGQEHEGGDVISLYQELKGLDFKEAFEFLAKKYLDEDVDRKKITPPQKDKRAEQDPPERPKPLDVDLDTPKKLWRRDDDGSLDSRKGMWDPTFETFRSLEDCSAVHIQTAAYQSEGAYAFCSLRWDPTDEHKMCRPCFADLSADQILWRPGLPDANILRPLYNLEDIEAYPETPIIVVEGEKCMDAVEDALFFSGLKDYIVTTNLQGSNSTGKTDWKPLRDRDVTILPDYDYAGAKLAMEVTKKVRRTNILWVKPPPKDWQEADKETWESHTGDDDGYDIADYLEEGGDLGELLKNESETLQAKDLEEEDDEEGDRYIKLRGRKDYHIAEKTIEMMRYEDGHHPLCNRKGNVWRYKEDKGCWDKLEGDWNLEGQIRKLFGGAIYPSGDDWKVLTFNRSKETSCAEEVKSMLKHRYGASCFEPFPVTYSFKNGTLVYRKGDGALDDPGELTFEPHAPSFRCRYYYDFEYTDAEQETPLFDHFIDGLFKPDDDADQKKELLQEFLGAGFFGFGYRRQQALILKGGGSDGKSQILEMMNEIAPRKICRNLAPQKLQNDPSTRLSLSGARLNLVEELPKSKIVQSNNLKLILGGGEMEDRELYDDENRRVRYIATHIMAANNLPAVSEMSRGFWRRWKILTFNREFTSTPDRDDPYQGKKIYDIGKKVARKETPGIIRWLVEGARRALRRGKYPTPPSSKRALRQWRGNANTMMAWATERVEPAPHEKGTSSRKLWEDYREWCENNGIRAKFRRTKGSFQKNLKHIDIGVGEETHRLTSKHFRDGNKRPCKLVSNTTKTSSALH